MSPYREILTELRKAFPPPVSDPVHDGYVVLSLRRALDEVDALKSQAPILGRPREPDFEGATLERVAEQGQTLEQVIPELVSCLDGMLIWSHPCSQVNVTTNPSIAGVIGAALPSMFNPNLCSDESGRGFSEAEVRVASMMADLVGYDPAKSGGLFTFGGTGTLLYGLKIGVEKTSPGTMRQGLHEKLVILASQHSHYACLNVAGWLGIGQENVVRVATHADNSIDVAALEAAAREAIASGQKIAAIVATMGTTDAFGIDDLAALHEVRQRLMAEGLADYPIHLHADAVIGWAWSVFNGYDYHANPLGFRSPTVRGLAAIHNRMRHLALADSLGIDFHKTGFAPYVSSLLLVRDRHDFQFLSREREAMPYLYFSGQYHPGLFTLETTRAAGGPMAALANLLFLGKQGMRTLMGHTVEMAEWLRELIGSRPELAVVNALNHGPVTLFRAYPEGVDTFRVLEREQHDPTYRDQLRVHNEYNRRIFRYVNDEALSGRGVAIGFTDNAGSSDYGEPIVALKSYVLSPFADESRMQAVVDHVLAAGTALVGHNLNSEI